MPAAVRRSMELWIGCVAGALEEAEYRRLLAEVGFEAIEIEPTRDLPRRGRPRLPRRERDGRRGLAAEMDGKVMSAFVRARKPV